MLGFQEIYTQSVISDSLSLWPSRLFASLVKVYLFESSWVIEKQAMQEIIETENELKEKFLIIPDSADTGLIKGIYNKETGIAILNETLLPRGSLSNAERIRIDDRSEAEDWHLEVLREKEKTLLQSAKTKLLLAQKYSKAIRKIHDSLIKPKPLMEFQDAFIERIFHNRSGNHERPKIDKAFFGTNAAVGPIYINQFHNPIDQCFIIKCEGSSAAAHLLKQVSEVATKKGFDTLLYHCPFFTDELDCVVIPELKTVIIESEEPHIIEPLHPNEAVLSIGDICYDPESLFSYSLEIRELEAKYKQYMRQAVLFMQEYGRYKRQEMGHSKANKTIQPKKLFYLLLGKDDL